MHVGTLVDDEHILPSDASAAARFTTVDAADPAGPPATATMRRAPGQQAPQPALRYWSMIRLSNRTS